MEYEKKIPTAPLIVARLSRGFCCGTSRIELLHWCETDDKHPITHPAGYYDDSGDEVPITAIESWLDVNLPRPAESEDERIRKELITYHKKMAEANEETCNPNNLHTKWVAYLENLQKEQKPAEWSEDDEIIRDSIIEYINSGNIYATSKVNMLTWLKSLRPDGYSIKSKGHLNPNEEDTANITDNKKFFLWIYNRLLYVYKENADIDYMRSFRKRIDQLFSKPLWKPSEEQMEALGYFIQKHKAEANAATGIWQDYENLVSLRHDLKTL